MRLRGNISQPTAVLHSYKCDGCVWIFPSVPGRLSDILHIIFIYRCNIPAVLKSNSCSTFTYYEAATSSLSLLLTQSLKSNQIGECDRGLPLVTVRNSQVRNGNEACREAAGGERVI